MGALSGSSIPLSVTVLALAATSALAIWSVLQRDRDLRRRAVVLRRHPGPELEAQQAKLQQLRGRARGLAASHGRARDHRLVDLIRSCDTALAGMKALRGDLLRATGGMEHLHGRPRQDAHRELEAVGAKMAHLRAEVKRHETLWAAEAARLAAASTAQASVRKPVRRVA